MKSFVSALVRAHAASSASGSRGYRHGAMSRGPLGRLLALAPAALLLSGLFTVWAGPLAKSVAAASLAPGRVVAWGRNAEGGTVPAGLSGVVAIAAGQRHSLALKSDGTVVAWGATDMGQSTVPPGLSGVTAIAAGSAHSLALKSDGTVVGWGENAYGQATLPAGLSGVTAIAGGGEFSLALKEDGTVVAWGDNRYGQTTVPTGLSAVIAIAAGGGHSLALKADGTVVAWGENNHGESTVPAGLSGVTAIAAGYWHSLALKADGTVVAWGDATDGQTTVPTGLSGVAAIAAGYWHSLALTADGTVVAWGDDSSGQTDVPAGLSGVGAIAAGYDFSLALGADVSAPTSPSVNINGGQPYSSATTTLTLAATDDVGVTAMRISQDSGFSGATWQPYATSASFTISGGDGSTQTVYAQFRDFSGNTSSVVSDSVVLDLVPPTSSVSALPPAQSTTSFPVAWSGSDDRSGVATYDVQVRDDGLTPPGGTGTPGTWTDFVTGTSAITANFDGAGGHRYCFRSRAHDVAGNIEAYPTDPDAYTRVADTAGPGSGSVLIAGGAGATDSTSVSVSLSATDDIGVTQMRLSEDSGFSGATWQPFATSASFTLAAGDGTHTIYAQFADADGNPSAIVSDSIVLDTVAPSGTIVLNSGALSTTSVTVNAALTASDDRSGVTAYRLSNDGSTWLAWTTMSGSATSAWGLAGGDGTHTVFAQFEDAAGNVSLPASDAIDLDSGVYSSEYNVSINAGADFTNSQDVVLDLYGPAGTTQIEISNDGGFAGAVWEPYVAHRAWTLGDPHGQIVTKVVYVRFRAADGTTNKQSDDIVIDPTAPTSSLSSPAIAAAALTAPDAQAAAAKSATINTTATDQANGSGVALMELSTRSDFAGAVWQPYKTSVAFPYDTRATTIVYVRFMDGAGNVSASYRKTLASPAPPTIPTQRTPMSGTLATSLRQTFAWSALGGGPKYELEVSTSSSFGTHLVDITTASLSFRPASALPASKALYWRVRVAAGAWSPTWSFTTPAGDPPTLVSPAASATLTTLSPVLSWSAVSGATSYQVQLGRDSAFLAGVHTYSSTKTSLHLVPLARLAGYTWRVRAMFGTKPGPWSASRSFSTPALGQVALASPANGAALPSSGRLDWADVTGASSYRLQICSNSACTSILADVSVANSVYRPSGLAVNWYWWRVRANGPSSTTGAWSPIWLVLVKPGTPGASTGVKATPLNHSASVSWTAPVSNGGSSIKGYTVTSSPGAKTCTTTGKTSCTVSGLTIGLTYTFTVRATNATRTGPPSNASASVAIGVATHLSVSTVSPYLAGTTHSVTVKALDAYGNVATGYMGTIHFTSSDAKASLPANYKFTASDKGVHTFTLALVLRTAGSRWVRATDKATASITGFQTVSVT
jgi:hypothetical protein